MTDERQKPAADRNRLDDVIAAYLQKSRDGAPPDRQRLLNENPELASELESFFAIHDEMKRADSEEVTLPRRPPDDPPDRPHGSDFIVDGSDAPVIRYFGDYELIEELARGGMGVVYKARQVNLNRLVALKMILAGQLASEGDVHRFYAEAEAAASLDHPGIVPIFEVGNHQGQHYFSMGLIEGESLADKLNDGPLAPHVAADYVSRISEAISYAHGRGVIHRDLKPANVLLGHDNSPRVTDFGLAKKVEGESELTATGQILGTPSYMPPEAPAADKELPFSSQDDWSLTAIPLGRGRGAFICVAAAFGPGIKWTEREQHLEPYKFLENDSILAISPAGFAVCSRSDEHGNPENYSCWLVDCLGGDSERELPDLVGPAVEAEFSADGKLLAIATRTEIGLWNVASAKRIEQLPRPDDRINSIAFSPDARWMAWSVNKSIHVWDCRTHQLRSTFIGHTSHLRDLAFNGDGSLLASAGDDRMVGVWDVVRGELKMSLTGHASSVVSVSFSPGGRTLASGAKTIRLWDTSSGELRSELHAYEHGTLNLTWSRDGRTIAAQGHDSIRLWNAAPDKLQSDGS